MNPFELTKDPDGGGITVRVKHGFVVLTREEERRVTERITEILAENAKLRELSAEMYPYASAFTQLGVNLGCNDSVSYDWYLQLRELGIEVHE